MRFLRIPFREDTTRGGKEKWNTDFGDDTDQEHYFVRT